MFHYYFLGNPEGIGFDAPDTDYLTCIWAPLRALPGAATGRRSAPARRRRALAPATRAVARRDRRRGARHPARRAGARPRRAARRWSRRPVGARPRWRRPAAACAVAPPFAVARLWLDRDVAPDRPTFNAVSREPTLDSITVYSRLERPSAEWAARTGGSVRRAALLRLRRAGRGHGHRPRMRAELRALWPETADARVVHRQVRLEATAPDVPARHGGHPAAGHRRRRPGCGSRATTSTRRTCAGSWSARPSPACWPRTTCWREVGARPEPVRGRAPAGPARGLAGQLSRASRTTATRLRRTHTGFAANDGDFAGCWRRAAASPAR